jgi:hypothetical protein
VTIIGTRVRRASDGVRDFLDERFLFVLLATAAVRTTSQRHVTVRPCRRRSLIAFGQRLDFPINLLVVGRSRLPNAKRIEAREREKRVIVVADSQGIDRLLLWEMSLGLPQ